MGAGEFVATTTTELHERVGVAHARFAGLCGSAPDDARVGEWSVPQVVGHLVTVVNRYTAFDPKRLADRPRGVDAINAQELEALDCRTVEALLVQLDEEMRRFSAMWGPEAGLPLDGPVPFHGGATIDVQSAVTNLLGEFLVHGLDVAEATGRDWPIDERDGVLLCGFATQILPFYVRSGPTDGPRVRIDADGVVPWSLDLTGRPVGSHPWRETDVVDLRVEGPAAPIALLFYGRLEPAQVLAAGVAVASDAPEEGLADLAGRFEEP